MEEEFANPPNVPDFVHGETENYEDFAAFLNECIAVCDHAYDRICDEGDIYQPFTVKKRALRHFDELCFTEYNKDTGDIVNNAPRPLKPDLVAVRAKFNALPDLADLVCYWKLREETKFKKRIEIACEMKKWEWKDLVLQSATYGRAESTGDPLRTFTLVLAVSYIKKKPSSSHAHFPSRGSFR